MSAGAIVSIHLSLFIVSSPSVLQGKKDAITPTISRTFLDRKLTYTLFVASRVVRDLLQGSVRHLAGHWADFNDLILQGPGKKWEHYETNKNGKVVRPTMHIRKGDTVQIIAGKDKGKVGQISKVSMLSTEAQARAD